MQKQFEKWKLILVQNETELKKKDVLLMNIAELENTISSLSLKSCVYSAYWEARLNTHWELCYQSSAVLGL
jgi:hypothetical protein